MNIDTLNAHGGLGSTRGHARLRVGEQKPSRYWVGMRGHAPTVPRLLPPPRPGSLSREHRLPGDLKFTPRPCRFSSVRLRPSRVATALPLPRGRIRLALRANGPVRRRGDLRVPCNMRAAGVEPTRIRTVDGKLVAGRRTFDRKKKKKLSFFSDLRSDEITR